MEGREVHLIVRAGCHLCEAARKVVRSVCDPMQIPVLEVDVDSDPALRETYGELVPVVLVDGVQVDYWRIDPQRVRAALDPAPARRRGLLRRRRRQDPGPGPS